MLPGRVGGWLGSLRKSHCQLRGHSSFPYPRLLGYGGDSGVAKPRRQGVRGLQAMRA